MFEFSNQQCDESSLDWACKIFFLIDLLKLSAYWVNNFLKKKKKKLEIIQLLPKLIMYCDNNFLF
jgi:hypothetical protein